jgi:hypothetical protein
VKEAAALVCVDGRPRLPRRTDDGRLVGWARILPWRGDWKQHPGGLCTDATHPIILYGRRQTVKGAEKIRDSIFVCSVCKPQKPRDPVPRVYPPRPDFPEPTIREMTQRELLNVIHGRPRTPPWWPGAEPQAPASGDAAAMALWRREHAEWEKWVKHCQQARMRLVTFHLRLQGKGAPPESLRDFEL